MKIRKELKEIESQRDAALSQLDTAHSEIRSLTAELSELKQLSESQRRSKEERLAEAEKMLTASTELLESRQKYVVLPLLRRC